MNIKNLSLYKESFSWTINKDRLRLLKEMKFNKKESFNSKNESSKFAQEKTKNCISEESLNNKENVDANVCINKENSITENKKFNPNINLNSSTCNEKTSNSNQEMEQLIDSLRITYKEMKKEREKVEKDTERLHQKLKIIQSEELKSFNKFQREKKFKEEWDIARQKTLNFKKFLNDEKNKRKHDSEELSKKIKETREYLQKSLYVKKIMKLQENKLTNLLMKQEKIEISELRRSIIKEEYIRNKRIALSVKIDEKTYAERKKSNENAKKMKLLKELQEKLIEEINKKKLSDSKYLTLEELETSILKKMKISEENDFNVPNCNNRSVSTKNIYRDKKEENKLNSSSNK